MIIDRYTKAVLTVIAVALMLIAIQPLLAPQPSNAEHQITAQLDRMNRTLVGIFSKLPGSIPPEQ